MPASVSLADLPTDLVWRADRLSQGLEPGIPTGFDTLDAQLPGGGWPRRALTELLIDTPGIGELSLLLPLFQAASDDRWIAWIAPPHLPYAPALADAGVPLHRLLLLSPDNHAGCLWAARQALASGGCHAVLAWFGQAETAALRRLQLAAEATATPLFLFRPTSAAQQPSPAPLRLKLEARGDQLIVNILKRKGPAMTSPIHLPMSRRAAAVCLPRSSHAVVCTDLVRTAAAGLHAGRR